MVTSIARSFFFDWKHSVIDITIMDLSLNKYSFNYITHENDQKSLHIIIYLPRIPRHHSWITHIHTNTNTHLHIHLSPHTHKLETKSFLQCWNFVCTYLIECKVVVASIVQKWTLHRPRETYRKSTITEQICLRHTHNKKIYEYTFIAIWFRYGSWFDGMRMIHWIVIGQVVTMIIDSLWLREM